MLILENIFTKNECNNFIKKYNKFLDEEYEVVEVFYGRYDFKDLQLAQLIFSRIKDKLDDDIIEVSYKFYVSKYWPNSSFISEHADGNFSYENLISKYTFILYLNNDFDDGYTIFTKDNTIIVPKCGNILVLEQDIIHKGTAPKNGYKYILRGDLMIEDK